MTLKTSNNPRKKWISGLSNPIKSSYFGIRQYTFYAILVILWMISLDNFYVSRISQPVAFATR